MSAEQDKVLKPASLYRILDSFCKIGIAFRIENQKTYFANLNIHSEAPDIITICKDCGGIGGICDNALATKLQETCKENGFMIDGQNIWAMRGHCKDCRAKAV